VSPPESSQSNMSSTMRIRNCTQEDFFKLCEMDWAPLPKERDTIYLTLTIEHSELSFVAEDDHGAWLGVLLASRSTDGNSCFLNHLLVMNWARSKGVGSALVKHLQRICTGIGVRRIWLFTKERNRRFYLRLGFKEDSTFLEASVAEYARAKKGLVMTIHLPSSG
jgi:N-acetylglutamate synthase-like GNAT family acetyltransferase